MNRSMEGFSHSPLEFMAHVKFTFPLLIFLMWMSMAGCKQNGNETQSHAAGTTYTCPMHPQVVQDTPGNCPICGMELVKVTTGSQHSAHLMLTESQVGLANITTEVVGKKEIGQTVFVNGRLTTDDRSREVVSSRAAGRIEKLFVRETGQTIRAGDPLYTLYSEQLLTLTQEYLLAKEQFESLGKREKRYKSFLDAAERKLLLSGLTKKQIAQLANGQEPDARVTLLAPTSGLVSEINVTEGQYVDEGTRLYTIDVVSTLWVEADLYADEIPLVEVGDKIEVRTNGAGVRAIEARVIFLSPEFRNNTQITTMRAAIENPGGQLKPGQQAQILLSHSTHEAIAIPSDAVIRGGRGSHVYVQSGENTFHPREVRTGLETFDLVEITDGLNAGDTVVVSGAYLLYAEMVLKKGTDPMAVHSH